MQITEKEVNEEIDRAGNRDTLINISTSCRRARDRNLINYSIPTVTLLLDIRRYNMHTIYIS